MSRVRVSHRVEYLFVVSTAALVVRLPEPIAHGLGTLLGWIAGSILRIRRGVVLENLACAFPDRSDRWRRKVAGATYRHFGREAVSILRFPHMSGEEIRARCQVDGLDFLRGPIEDGCGVIGLAGHFGNWEIAALSATARGVPVAALARRQRNPLFDQYMKQVRDSLDIQGIPHSEATRGILRCLKEPTVVALVADQNYAGNGVFVDFFGFPASTARGPGVIASRTGVPVVFGDPRRLPGWRATYLVRFSSLEYESTDDTDENVRRVTSAYLAKLEGAVRESPEQYFWFHKRWKTRPPRSEPQLSQAVADGGPERLVGREQSGGGVA